MANTTTYNPKSIEPKWQKYWEEHETFKTDVWDFSKPKYYALDMFPYPSGVGLHAGHPEGYTATDITSRMKRMQGYNVLHPMGYDSFGLPAEQYAVKTGNNPNGFTEKNIETFTKQLKELGFDYDWSKKIATSDKVRSMCVSGLAKGMKFQQEAKETLQNMREEAEDMCYEAKSQLNDEEE